MLYRRLTQKRVSLSFYICRMNSIRFYSSFDDKIPEPIAFNTWKHHLGFVKDSIQSFEKGSLQNLAQQLIFIKGSILDLYTGNLTPPEISSQVLIYLTYQGNSISPKYISWLNAGNNFRNIELSDGSEWTLTHGRFPNRYIHIHPARNSVNIIRVRSGTLKVAILFSALNKDSKNEISLKAINEIRVNYLKLSPVKSINSSGSLRLLVNKLLG